jgi:hypothetical protein
MFTGPGYRDTTEVTSTSTAGPKRAVGDEERQIAVAMRLAEIS